MSDERPGGPTSHYSRRQFLRFTVSLGAGTLLPVRLALPARAAGLRPSVLATVPVAGPVDLYRAADLADLTFSFTNLQLNTAGPSPVLEPVNGAERSLITVTLHQQHVAERIVEDLAPLDPGPDTTRSRLSGTSRLVFDVTDVAKPIPFTAAGLLDRSADPLVLVPLANPPDSGPAEDPREPLDDETSIEYPWHLYLTPRGPTGLSEPAFANRTAPVEHEGRSELWHTRFVVRKDGEIVESPEVKLKARFAWTDGYVPGGVIDPDEDDSPITMALTTATRKYLVRATADYDDTTDFAAHAPVDVQHLVLTALGAHASMSGEWDGPLVSWRQRTWGGRDSLVRVVTRGYLFPLGHGASEIEVSTRQFRVDAAGGLTSYLYRETYLAVGETVKDYPAPHQADDARGFPFRSVEITNPATPDIEKDTDLDGVTGDAYYVQVAGDDYLFSCVGTDWDGQTATFNVPMAFVAEGNGVPFQTGADRVPSQLRAYLDGLAVDDGRRLVDLNGQSVAVAESSTGQTGDTAQPLVDLTLAADPPAAGTSKAQLEADGQPAFFPAMAQATIRLGAAEAVSGTTSASMPFRFSDEYVSDGFDANANPAELFLQVLDPDSDQLDMSFPDASRSGGLATPAVAVKALSRFIGPIGGDLPSLNGPGGGSWNPADAFGTALDAARLLGSLSLKDVVQEVLDLAANKLHLPKFLTHFEYPGGDILQLPERACTTLDWDPQLQSFGDLFIVADDLDDSPFDGPSEMHLHGEFCVPITADEDPTYAVTGALRYFAIQLLPGSLTVLILYFERVEFSAGSSAPTSVDANVLDVEFLGALSFIEAFRTWLTSLGNGPTIDVDAGGVSAGVSIDIPDLGFGVFSLTQMAFGMDFTVPFDGDPATVTFSFSTREDPFIVTVLGLGGGGNFAITLSADGLVSLEFSIDVAAQVSLDIIVASGSVGVTAGFSYEIDVQQTAPELIEELVLIAYVNVSGEVSVLGLITVSVEVEIALTYDELTVGDTVTKSLTGTASVEVEVDVLFVHESVTLEFSYTFDAGSGPAPLPAARHHGSKAATAASGFHFGDLYAAESQWDEYCGAFASV
jgi:hypothetical protein